MTTERDPRTRIVLSWLREDAHENAERVLLRALDEVDTTRQRRPWWAARRTQDMSFPYKVALAGAAVLLAALVGYNLLPRVSGPGQPTIEPTTPPTLLPTATANPTVPPIPPDGVSLAPGRYAISVPDSDVRAVVTVEDGWTSGGSFIMNPPGFNKQVSFWTVANVYTDVCSDADDGLPTASDLPTPAVGPTVEDLVAALDAQVNTDMSTPVDVNVGGYDGKRLTMRLSDRVARCTANFGPMWVDAESQPQRRLEPGDIDTLWIIDVAGRRVVIVTNTDPEENIEAAASIDAVLDSIEFEIP